jgi:hypothetical protein
MEVIKLIPDKRQIGFLDQLFIVHCQLELSAFFLAQQVYAENVVEVFLQFLEMPQECLFCLLVVFVELYLSVDARLFPEHGY